MSFIIPSLTFLRCSADKGGFAKKRIIKMEFSTLKKEDAQLARLCVLWLVHGRTTAIRVPNYSLKSCRALIPAMTEYRNTYSSTFKVNTQRRTSEP